MRALYLMIPLVAVLVAPGAPAQQVVHVKDLPTLGSGMGGGGGPFTLYSLRENRVVVGPRDEARSDSASTAWDIGFRGTTIIVNGGTSGPGQGAAALLKAPFETLSEAPPDSLFLTDGDGTCPQGDKYAICTGSGNGWYLYEGSGVIKPIPDLTLVVRLAEGGVAKLQLTSYALAGGEAPGERFYSFEYAMLSDSG